MHDNVVILAPLCEGYKLKMFSLAWWKGIEWRRTQSSIEPVEDMKIQGGGQVARPLEELKIQGNINDVGGIICSP